MGGTKIVVLQLRELIKTAIFALVGIVLIIMLIYFFFPKDKTKDAVTRYIPGTYSSQLTLNSDPVQIDVTVTETEITSIELKNMAEVAEVFYPLITPTFEDVSQAIIKAQSLDIPVSADTQFTSQVLLDAVSDALDQAAIES